MIPWPLWVIKNGRVADFRRAKQDHKCNECGLLIISSDNYYAVVIAGGGLGSLKNPDRVHLGCIEQHLSIKPGTLGNFDAALRERKEQQIDRN